MADMPSPGRPADPMVPTVAKIIAARQELADVWTLDIDTSAEGFRFAPGQFNMLYAFGVGEAAISISGDPAAPEKLIHTIRAVGKVSDALTRLKPGDTLGLRGPYGGGWPLAAAAGSDVVIVAGGLGLAPLRPTLYRLFAERERYGRIVILCGARGPGDILFREELAKWRERLDVEIEVTVDHADPTWHGNVGVVTTLIGRAAFDPAKTVAMLCGPEIMMRFAAVDLVKRGVPGEAIYLSMERNMKCAIGRCGHCQFSSDFVCKDGPVATWAHLGRLVEMREI
jgi:NAD(P)H-flavin reductase